MKKISLNIKVLNLIVLSILMVTNITGVKGATLWSTQDSYLGTGYFFGPGAYPLATPLFPAMIRNLAFTGDRDFVTPFWNNGAALPNIAAEADFPPIDGKLSDGTLINENVDLGTFVLAGSQFLPAVVANGKLAGQQIMVTMDDGNLIMVMDLILDLGIGSKGIIKLPLYGTTGTITIPQALPGSPVKIDRAGQLHSGDTIAGRIGDFNNDGYIDGTLVIAGVMPLTSPFYPGQPFVLSRNFETDIPLAGAILGSPQAVNATYSNASGNK
ncbi:hypothetical protein TI04_08190 [Achromatium sp. WMS2]|nr:hypothetical protein TI04_08190 [Achromatium sp. WMS2]